MGRRLSAGIGRGAGFPDASGGNGWCGLSDEAGNRRSFLALLFGNRQERAEDRSESRGLLWLSAVLFVLALGAALGVGRWMPAWSGLQTGLWILAALCFLLTLQYLFQALLAHTIGTRIVLILLVPLFFLAALWKILTFLTGD